MVSLATVFQLYSIQIEDILSQREQEMKLAWCFEGCFFLKVKSVNLAHQKEMQK